ncbi:MAG: DUF4262 domain-containing protein [Cytophagaceae bacterium]|nr:MAG: DUF4262 domain-containing protein [Cytophagaceae bacterium]
MITALDAPANVLDADEKSFIARIRQHGWFDTAVSGDDEGPGFSYTSGLWVNASQPEVIMFSMKREIAHDVFWDLFRDAQAGKGLEQGVQTDQVFGNLPAYAFPVAKKYYREYLGWNRWLYAGDNFPCIQIVWSDREGVFPWQEGFDLTFANDQPDLTESGWAASVSD